MSYRVSMDFVKNLEEHHESACMSGWGFLGAANIARKNWKAVRMSGNSVVKAVASRDLDRAEAFIQECSLEVPPVTAASDGTWSLQRPQAFGDYQQLIEQQDIDVIYVALPTAVRKPWVIAAAEAGKTCCV